jgi:hypothetical protein
VKEKIMEPCTWGISQLIAGNYFFNNPVAPRIAIINQYKLAAKENPSCDCSV